MQLCQISDTNTDQQCLNLLAQLCPLYQDLSYLVKFVYTIWR